MIERIDLVEHKFEHPTFKVKRLRDWLNFNDNWDKFDEVKEATKAFHDERRILDNKNLVDRCIEWNSCFSWRGDSDEHLIAGALDIYRLMKRNGLHEDVLSKYVEIDNLMRFAHKEVEEWAQANRQCTT